MCQLDIRNFATAVQLEVHINAVMTNVVLIPRCYTIEEHSFLINITNRVFRLVALISL